MFYNGKEGIVNLDHVFFVKKEFLFKAKQYVIIWQFNTGVGYMSWKYDTVDERDKEYDKIVKCLVG